MLLNPSSHQASCILSKAACALALALSLTAAACGQSPAAPQKPAAPQTPAASQTPPTTPAPAATPTPAPVTLDNTVWAVSDSAKNFYAFEFKSGGVFRSTSSSGEVRGGKWTREADAVVVRVDGNAAEYRGVFNGRSRIDGDAKLADNSTLKWQARREEAQPLTAASSSVPPDYPDAAAASRAEGVVVVEVKVDEKGQAAGARAVSGNALLQQAAVDAAERWRFNPEAGAAERTARLSFLFQTVPVDCKQKQRPAAPAPDFFSPYQVRVRRLAECVN